MNNPKVSIVVPIYKVPDTFLRQSIESLINQTLKEIEIILVDDGSPDGCGKICDEYAAKDNRLKVIHRENGGLAAARNTGQDNATGETLMFLDGDDYLVPNCCERVFNVIKQENVEVLMFDQYVNFPNSQETLYSFNDGSGSRRFSEEECKHLQLRVLDFNGNIAAAFKKLIRLDYLRKYNIRHIDNLKQGAEGFVFNIQLYEYLSSAYYLHEPLMHYIYNAQSISHTSSVKNNIYILKCMEWINEYVSTKSRNNGVMLHNAVLNRMLFIICTTAITGYFNPYNTEPHKERVKGFQTFMKHSLCRDSMKYASRKGVNLQRKIILIMIRFKQYRLIELLGWLRRKQLENK